MSEEIEKTSNSKTSLVGEISLINELEKKSIIENKEGKIKFSEEDKIVSERKNKIIKYFKKDGRIIYYVVLLFLTFIGVYIRTRNISKLKDITTNSWTLGPNLDPFLFLRWAEYIVENGKLMAVDMMRYVPFGYDTAGEMKLLSYLIAWFHNILSTLGFSDSVTYSAIIFPVFMFALTTIAFFLFSREIFHKEE